MAQMRRQPALRLSFLLDFRFMLGTFLVRGRDMADKEKGAGFETRA
jgi:hypothetical protein